MQTVTTRSELRTARACLVEPIGLVPTMGYLHAGHLTLVRAAKAENPSVVVSIFVNPTQFSPNEDLNSYPQDLSRDLQLLDAEGVDLVWTPTAEVMYPPNFQTWVDVDKLSQPLEGEKRPGHFRGVTTVVAKLFNAIQPNRAYFGQKDAQQTAVIRQMVRDLDFPIEIAVCPIIREGDGLALSSRNSYLSPGERLAATVLYRALTAARDAHLAGERDAEKLRKIMADTIQREPLARPQYISCAHPDSLQELDGAIRDRALLSMAVYIGNTRLIDNWVIANE